MTSTIAAWFTAALLQVYVGPHGEYVMKEEKYETYEECERAAEMRNEDLPVLRSGFLIYTCELR